MSKLLDQSRNYKAQFGLVFRSSAIFYIPADVHTTITFSNYWKFKNNLDVVLAATVRDMEGRVHSRAVIDFFGGLVSNIDDFPVAEGSIEIEAFGNTNLRIPYAAIMAVYETPNSISMVHSYGRNHSLIEIEDGQALTAGHEGCWTVNPDSNVQNLAFFHCGHTGLDAQSGTIELIDQSGNRHQQMFEISEQGPFATVMFDLDIIMPDFRDHLSGQDGWASLKFTNTSSFTRLLIMWRDRRDGQVQTTHSNFDYKSWGTNTIEDSLPAFMRVPADLDRCTDVNMSVYPNMLEGQYQVKGLSSGEEQTFSDAINADVEPGQGLRFERKDGPFPSRLVTGLRGQMSRDALRFECSLGVYHAERPPKRFHWSPVSARLKCKIHLEPFEEIYPNAGAVELVWRVYTPSNVEWIECKQCFDSLKDVPRMQTIQDLFPEIHAHLGEDFGYISLFSAYGGFLLFTSLEKGKSYTIEHSF